MIYLDHNATTPVDPAVLDAMMPFLREEWGNPSSPYKLGVRAKQAIESAREKVAALIGADPASVVFTSCATEANNSTIASALATQPSKRHIVTTAIEHSSVLGFCQAMARRGCEVTFVDVPAGGAVDPGAVAGAIRQDTALVSVMWANNETGVVQPVGEIASRCRAAGVPFHCDAVQAAGKVGVDFAENGCDFLSISGHKIGAPKGIGALVCRPGLLVQPLLVGGKQENGRRGGTESVPGIVGLGSACERAREYLASGWRKIEDIRDEFERRLLAEIEGSYVNGRESPRLPNTSSFGIEGVDGDAVVAFMDRHDVCLSSGSACLEQSIAPSHVIYAMRRDYSRANEAVRISLGRTSALNHIERVLHLLKMLVRLAR